MLPQIRCLILLRMESSIITIRLTFVKKTCMPNPAKSLGYIKCHSLSSPRPVESPSNSIRYKKICRWSKRPKTILEIRKRSQFSRWLTNLLFTTFKNFTNHRKKTNRVAVFSSRPFPNILKYRDQWWNLPLIWKTRLHKKLIEEFS